MQNSAAADSASKADRHAPIRAQSSDQSIIGFWRFFCIKTEHEKHMKNIPYSVRRVSY